MAPSGPEYRIVTVQFMASGRTYDYICDLEDVQVGDTVIVKGYSGKRRSLSPESSPDGNPSWGFRQTGTGGSFERPETCSSVSGQTV